MHKRLISVAVAGVIAIGSAGCAAETASAPAGREKAPATVIQLPAPTGEPVLTIEPAVGTTRPLQVDLTGLRAVSASSYDIFEPFEEREITFRGVELGSVLAATDADGADSYLLTALDDYRVVLTAEEISAGGIILAVEADGAGIPIESGGPVRVVFVDGSEAGANTDNWIWSLERITAQ